MEDKGPLLLRSSMVSHLNTQLSRACQIIGDIAKVRFHTAQQARRMVVWMGYDFETGKGNVGSKLGEDNESQHGLKEQILIDFAMRHFTKGKIEYYRDGE